MIALVRTAWRNVSPADRARVLRRFAEVVDTHLEELATIEVRNAGHPAPARPLEAGNVRDVLALYVAPGRTSLWTPEVPAAGGADLTFMSINSASSE